MSLIAKKTTRPPVPAGQYAARCIDVYDAGWWKKMDSEEHVQKCKVVFVLDELAEDGKPYLIDAFETLSLNEKANLHKMLVAWRGKAFTAAELEGFDLEKLVGVGALIQVIHKTKADGTPRAQIGTIMALPKGMAAPEVPEGYKRDRERDEQFADKHPRPAGQGGTHAEEGRAWNEDEDDDLPF